jgi:hypothetical protein
MRIFKPLLIAAMAGLPFVALAQSTTATEQTMVKPNTQGTAVGVPGVASPRSTTMIVPHSTDDVTKSESSGGGESGGGSGK